MGVLRPTGSIIMAIAYLELKLISRGHATQNRNCVGASAYNSREKLYSTDNGHTYNYNFKSADVENKNVLLPEHAPQEYKNRQTLWQAVEKAETSNKAQLARKIILALPKETTAEQRKELVENYCNTAFVKEGMCVDYAIHKPDKGNENYHCHIMLTMRSIDEHGQWQNKKSKIYVLDKNGNKIPIIDKETGKQKIADKGRLMFKTQTIKTNDWDNPKNLEKWRNLAEQEINKYLPKEKQISMKSYERQGIDKVAQVHEGYSQNGEKKSYNEKAKIINSKSQDVDNEIKNWEAIKNKIQNEKIAENENNRLSNTGYNERKDPDTVHSTPEKPQISQPKAEPEQKTVIAHEQQEQKPEQKSEARLKLEKQKEQIEKQLAEQQKKPKAKLVKSEWQKQRDKERQNSRGISR